MAKILPLEIGYFLLKCIIIYETVVLTTAGTGFISVPFTRISLKNDIWARVKMLHLLRTELECAMHCSNDVWCNAFFFDIHLKQCLLANTDTNQDVAMISSRWLFYRMKAVSFTGPRITSMTLTNIVSLNFTTDFNNNVSPTINVNSKAPITAGATTIISTTTGAATNIPTSADANANTSTTNTNYSTPTTTYNNVDAPTFSDANFNGLPTTDVNINGPITADVSGPPVTDASGPPSTDVSTHGPTITDFSGPPSTDVSTHGPTITDVSGPPSTDFSTHGPTITDVNGPNTRNVNTGGPATSDVDGPTSTDFDGPPTTDVSGPATTVFNTHGPTITEVNGDISPVSDVYANVSSITNANSNNITVSTPTDSAQVGHTPVPDIIPWPDHNQHGCSHSFVPSVNKCVSFQTDSVTYLEAFIFCQRWFGKLVDFQSSREFMAFRSVIQKHLIYNRFNWHIGLVWYEDDSVWKWLNTGSTVHQSDGIWASGRPLWGIPALGAGNDGHLTAQPTTQGNGTPNPEDEFFEQGSGSSDAVNWSTPAQFSGPPTSVSGSPARVSEPSAAVSGSPATGPPISVSGSPVQRSTQTNPWTWSNLFESQWLANSWGTSNWWPYPNAGQLAAFCGSMMAADNFYISDDACLSSNKKSYVCQY